MIVGNESGAVGIFDLELNPIASPFAPRAGSIIAIAASKTADVMAVATSADGKSAVRLVDTTGTRVGIPLQHSVATSGGPTNLSATAFLAKNEGVIAADGAGRLNVSRFTAPFSIALPTPAPQIEAPSVAPMPPIAVDWSTGRIAVGGRVVSLWRVDQDRLRKETDLPRPPEIEGSGEIRQVAFSANGRRVSALSTNGWVVTWDVEPQRTVAKTHLDAYDKLFSFALSHNGEQFATSEQAVFHVRNVNGSAISDVRMPRDVSALAFSMDDAKIIAGDVGGNIVVSAVNGSNQIAMQIANKPVRSIAVHPDGATGTHRDGRRPHRRRHCLRFT